MFTAPTEVNDLADAIARLLEVDILPRTIHLAAPEYISRYEFARAVVAAKGLDSDKVKPVPAAELGLIAPRPLRAGLRSDYAAALVGRRLRTVTEIL
jgi:dTDP-4-dehydrorhamnose reductase